MHRHAPWLFRSSGKHSQTHTKACTPGLCEEKNLEMGNRAYSQPPDRRGNSSYGPSTTGTLYCFISATHVGPQPLFSLETSVTEKKGCYFCVGNWRTPSPKSEFQANSQINGKTVTEIVFWGV